MIDFLSWHYTQGIEYYIARFRRILFALFHYFSPILLLTHLFSPWKRLIVNETVPGLALEKRFEAFSFNLVSRFIGAIARFVLCFVSLIVLITASVAGAIGFMIWIVLPFLSWSTYQLYRRQPIHVVQSILQKIARGSDTYSTIFGSEAGGFVLSHIGIPFDEGRHIFAIDPTRTIPSTAVTFYEILENLLKDNQIIQAKLSEKNMSIPAVLLAARWWDRRRSFKTEVTPPITHDSLGIGQSLLYGYTPTLDKFSTNMGLTQEFSHHLIGRKNLVERIVRSLTQHSIMLTGIPGVGKKTVIYELAKHSTQRFLLFDYVTIISGSSDIAQKKVLLSNALSEATYAGNIVLVIRDIERLLVSSLEGVDMSDIFEQFLSTGKLKIVAIEDDEQYERYIAPNAKLTKYFEHIVVHPMEKSDAEVVLLDGAREWEKKEGLIISIQAIAAVLDGSDQYLSDTPFPEKALELLDAVVNYALSNHFQFVSEEHVRTVLSEKTGISMTSLAQNEKDRLSNLEELIHERLINQEESINLIAQILRSKTSGVISTNRPIGSFLFLGPTGVGKTETAKALSNVYFGGTQIIRLNMAEYVGPEGVSRLIGSQALNLPGQLTSAIHKSPASLLLLDEIEKAPREVINLLLALLDEGQISDAFGKTYKCSHLFVIATSNAGADLTRTLVKENVKGKELSDKLVEHVIIEKIFTPEFINRFDGVVVYEPLSKDHLLSVARLMLNDFAKTVEQKNIHIEFNEEAIQKVVEMGYDPALGARPMRRIIEITLGDLIGRAILSNEVKSGEHIRVRPDGGKVGWVWEKI